MISPQPPRLRMKRRKTVSVTPAIGARTVAGAIVTGPIETWVGNGCMTLSPFILAGRRLETKPGGQPSFACTGEVRMKPVQILMLVVAGVLGGAVITRVWQKPKAPVAVGPMSAQVRETPAAESLPEYVAPPAPVPQQAPQT